MSLTRRRFLRLLAAGGVSLSTPLACSRNRQTRTFSIPGEIANPHTAYHGHLMRASRSSSEFALARGWLDTVVIGGGVSGLSACWKLKQHGVDRVKLLELDPHQVGGTSAAGTMGQHRFPWGAHYINMPPREADCIHEVLVDLKVITGYDAAGRPRANPDYLLRWPHERLFVEGSWREGLDPYAGSSSSEAEMLEQFEDDMLRWSLYHGLDGRRAFALPLSYSSSDSSVRDLDDMSMLDYLMAKGWSSERLKWLVSYACRDDYGCAAHQVSAWAGIHYYACRAYDRRISHQYPSDTLTWDQGNAFLADGLAACLGRDEITLGAAVVNIRQISGGVEVAYIDVGSGSGYALRTRSVVYAAKLHTAPYAMPDLPAAQQRAIGALEYTPWLVAALQLSRLPERSDGAEPAWDNVLYDSPSVGYLVADHQSRGRGSTSDDPTGSGAIPGSRVLVYYLPFNGDPAAGRRELLQRDHGHWVNHVMSDLITVHPNLDQLVERLDVYRWGHAMVRPGPGVIWGKASGERARTFGPIAFATCDVTGLPLFEESCYSGIRAAERCLERLDVPFSSSVKGPRNA